MNHAERQGAMGIFNSLLAAVQGLVFAADLKSFTRAAEAMNTTQAAMSLKIKRLEDVTPHRFIQYSTA